MLAFLKEVRASPQQCCHGVQGFLIIKAFSKGDQISECNRNQRGSHRNLVCAEHWVIPTPSLTRRWSPENSRARSFETEGTVYSRETSEGSSPNRSAQTSPRPSLRQLLLVCDKGQQWKRGTEQTWQAGRAETVRDNEQLPGRKPLMVCSYLIHPFL